MQNTEKKSTNENETLTESINRLQFSYAVLATQVNLDFIKAVTLTQLATQQFIIDQSTKFLNEMERAKTR